MQETTKKWQNDSQHRTGCGAISNLQAIRLSVGKLTREHCNRKALWMLIVVPQKEKTKFLRQSSLQGVH